MTHIYDVMVATQDGDKITTVKTIKEAREFVKKNGVGGSYSIDRVVIGKLSVELLIDVINSQGGNYCINRKTVESSR